ncbi:class I SAM-dependent methyltransferase [Leifsonia flava]|uniref:class I SAM-dependent methyltransferase n=1 Tax=Orlajensenia leifsoniae TaxID=2561933 RepID=UPI00142FFFE8|nr:class I SAM-dependent methyltransferase [Leifsonia flava]
MVEAHHDSEDAVRPDLPLVARESFETPRHLVLSAWLEHAPFAAWIVGAVDPGLFVELGTHNGFSYFQFCENIVRRGLSTRAIAVDTWLGDDHAGFYDEDVFELVESVNTTSYSSFSRLFRGTFDEALGEVQDQSVDLLHIDGRHGYEDVRHDFETWRPKLSTRSVVLFHDIAERREGFGVWRLWEELSADYPAFDFSHGHGLGVLATGQDQSPAMAEFFRVADSSPAMIRAIYEGAGARVARDYAASLADREKEQEMQSLRSMLLVTEAMNAEAETRSRLLVAELESAREAADVAREDAASAAFLVSQLDLSVAEMRASTSWRVTRPLRAIKDGARRLRRGRGSD